MKFRNLISFVCLFWIGTIHAQVTTASSMPSFEVSFSPLVIKKYTKELECVDSSHSLNEAYFIVSDVKKTIEYIEYNNFTRKVVNKWEYEIISFNQMELVYVFSVLSEDGEKNILFWKDGLMVVIEELEWDYIISDQDV